MLECKLDTMITALERRVDGHSHVAGPVGSDTVCGASLWLSSPKLTGLKGLCSARHPPDSDMSS